MTGKANKGKSSMFLIEWRELLLFYPKEGGSKLLLCVTGFFQYYVALQLRIFALDKFYF
jgi:hypothetical protein